MIYFIKEIFWDKLCSIIDVTIDKHRIDVNRNDLLKRVTMRVINVCNEKQFDTLWSEIRDRMIYSQIHQHNSNNKNNNRHYHNDKNNNRSQPDFTLT